ncbi:MAG: SMC-Scp complex subunit ScpB [Kofleriaceae bacterium]
MSRKRSRKHKPEPVEAVPEEILAEGSGAVADLGEIGEAVAAMEASSDAESSEAEAAGEAEALQVHGDGDVPTVQPEELDQLASDGDNIEVVEAASEHGEVASADAETETEAGEESIAAAEVEHTEGELAAESTDEETFELPTSAASMEPDQLKRLVEALVFASDRPVTVLRLRQLTRVSDVKRLDQALADLAEDYKDRGLILQQVSGGFQFRTRSQYSPWVQQLIAGRPVRLSRAQLETLAIIAYRQPITRPEIDEIRGVDSSGTLRVLSERGLVRCLGKKEDVGRPMLYGTTKEFLDFFSLGDLRELPTLREYSELSEESRRVMTDRLGAIEDENDAAQSEPVVSAPADAASPDEPLIADGSDATPLAEAMDDAADGDAAPMVADVDDSDAIAMAEGSDATPVVSLEELAEALPMATEPEDPDAAMIAAENLEPDADDPAEPAHE